MASGNLNDILMLMSALFDESEAVDKYKLSGMLKQFATKASKKLEATLNKTDDSLLPTSGKEACEKLSEVMMTAFGTRVESSDFGPLTNLKLKSLQMDMKAMSEWQSGLVGWIESQLPPHVDSLPTHIVNWLSENFMFTKSSDNRNICYFRNKDLPGKCWQEVGYISQNGTAHVFSCLHGAIRAEFVRKLIQYGEADYCDVYTEDSVEIHKAKYKLWIPIVNRYVESCEKGEAQKFAFDYLNGIIETMKRKANGELVTSELQNGLHNIDAKLEELDAFGQKMEPFWRNKIHLPALTNDPEEDALHYYDLTDISDGYTPVFDMLLSGVVECCRGTLMAMVWATFYAKSHMQKYVWLHGEGGDGKSVFVRTMMEILGSDIASALTADTIKSEFGLENVVGRRMLLIPDLKAGVSVKKAFIHNVTGGDPVSVNRKNKPVITTVLDPILWITANNAPDVDFTMANEARRLVYIKFQQPPMEVLKKICKLDKDGNPVKDEDGHYIKSFDMSSGLKKEWKHVLWKCKQAYDCLNFNNTELSISEEEQGLRKANCVDDQANLWDRLIDKVCIKTDSYEDSVERPEFFKKFKFHLQTDEKGRSLNQFDKQEITRHLAARGFVAKTNDGVPNFKYMKLK